jgi:uncharacterized protein (TIGR02996 family)
MTRDEAFLADIREHPKDDGPRLVYSDWLEDNGDPERAEFIRLQCRLAPMDWRDPGYKEMEKRAETLEWKNRERWLAGCPKEVLTGSRRRLTFHRGFVEQAGISLDDFHRYGAILLDLFPIQNLHLQGKMGKAEAAALAAAPPLKRVPGLVLGGGDDRCNKQSLEALLASPHLTNLRELHLAGYRVSPAALRVLAKANLPGLRVLNLYRNDQLGDQGAETLAGATFAHQLTDLDLGGTSLTDAGAKILAGCSQLKQLRRLVLGTRFGSGNRVGAEGTKALLTSPFLSSLTQVELSDNPIGAGGAEALAAWPWLANVRDLCLRQCNIGSEGLAALARSPHLGNVVYIELLRNDIGAEGAIALAGASHITRLRELDLGWNDIGDRGAEALAAAPHLASLVKLNLWNNQIEDVGAAALARSPWLTELTELRLAGNRIGDAGVRALAESSIWQHHKKVDLSGNHIGNDGVAALAECAALAGLTDLELSSNRITAAGMLALAASSVLPRGLNLDLRSNVLELRERKAVKEAIHKRFSAPRVWL